MAAQVDLDLLIEAARLRKEREERRRRSRLYRLWLFLLANPIIFALLASSLAVTSGVGAYWGVRVIIDQADNTIAFQLVEEKPPPPPPPEPEPEPENKPRPQQETKEQPKPLQPMANTVDTVSSIDRDLLFNGFSGFTLPDEVVAPVNSGIGTEPVAPPPPPPPPPPPMMRSLPVPMTPRFNPPNVVNLPLTANVARNEDFVDYRSLNQTVEVHPRTSIAGLVGDYPEVARRGELQGTVGVVYDVGTDGRAGNVRLTHQAGIGMDQAVLDAASRMEHDPIVIEGVPVEVRNIPAEVRFQLDH